MPVFVQVSDKFEGLKLLSGMLKICLFFSSSFPIMDCDNERAFPGSAYLYLSIQQFHGCRETTLRQMRHFKAFPGIGLES